MTQALALESHKEKEARRHPSWMPPGRLGNDRSGRLLLPGALFVTMGAKFLAPFVLINFRFAPFL
jgi:hypothetical protein